MTIEDKIPNKFLKAYRKGLDEQVCNKCKYYHVVRDGEGLFDYCSVKDEHIIFKMGCEDYEE